VNREVSEAVLVSETGFGSSFSFAAFCGCPLRKCFCLNLAGLRVKYFLGLGKFLARYGLQWSRKCRNVMKSEIAAQIGGKIRLHQFSGPTRPTVRHSVSQKSESSP
jgi:hypothetical protein